MAKKLTDVTVDEVRFVRRYVDSGKVNASETWESVFMPDGRWTPELKRRYGLFPQNMGAFVKGQLRRVAIASLVDKFTMAAASLVDLKPIDIVRAWADIAMADARELVTVRRVNCRCCWGVKFQYQWTERERDADLTAKYDAWLAARERKIKGTPTTFVEPKYPGGVGFTRNRPPHPDCPECAGEGREDVHIADFATLSRQGAALLAGVKATKDGIEVKMHDRVKALEALSKFFGITPETIHVILSSESGSVDNAAPVLENLSPSEAANAYRAFMESTR